MASDFDLSSPQPASIARLDAAVNDLEQVIEQFERAHRLTADELAQTKAELAALQALHVTVSHRLDETIARLKRVLSEQAVDNDPSDDESGA